MRNEKSVYIVSDELSPCDELVNLIKRETNLYLGGFNTTGIRHLKEIDHQKYDLIIADIDQPAKKDFRILKELTSMNGLNNIILSTGAADQALNAYDLGLFDFLARPFSLDRFKQAIKRFLSLKGLDHMSGLFSIDTKQQTYNIRLNDITHIQAANRKARIFSANGVYDANYPLKDYLSMLPDDNFVQIHKQYIVNINQIERIKYYLSGRYNVYLKNGSEATLPVGIKYAEPLKQILGLV